jgi:membrane fusion protein, heavy metal efflux system
VRRCALTLGAICLCAQTVPAQVAPYCATHSDGVVGMTTPSRQAMLATIQLARIADIPAKEGTYVAAGQLVVAFEDGVQAARVAVAKLEAESTEGVELARVRLDYAERELARFQKLNVQDYATSKEYTDARTTAETARLEFEVAKVTRAKAIAVYHRERELLDQYRIVAPFPGYVARHLKHPGESVNYLEGIVQLVQLDPMVVSVDCPLALAPQIAAGDSFSVVPADGRLSPRDGVVTLASRVADAASQTFKVKLTVANTDVAWPVGMKVVVRFCQKHARATPMSVPRPWSPVETNEGQ